MHNVYLKKYKKGIIVYGNTRDIKDELTSLGGKWVPSLHGWIFKPNSKDIILSSIPGVIIQDEEYMLELEPISSMYELKKLNKPQLETLLTIFSKKCPKLFEQSVKTVYPILYFLYKIKNNVISNISKMYPFISSYEITMNPSMKRNLIRINNNQIELSSFFLLNPKTTEYDCNDILLHGVAHAINDELHKNLPKQDRPKSYEHDESWKEIALNIGCTGNICRPDKFAKDSSGKVIKNKIDKSGPKYTLHCTHETEKCDPEFRKCKRKDIFYCKKHKLPRRIEQHYFGGEENDIETCMPIDGLPE